MRQLEDDVIITLIRSFYDKGHVTIMLDTFQCHAKMIWGSSCLAVKSCCAREIPTSKLLKPAGGGAQLAQEISGGVWGGQRPQGKYRPPSLLPANAGGFGIGPINGKQASKTIALATILCYCSSKC